MARPAFNVTDLIFLTMHKKRYWHRPVNTSRPYLGRREEIDLNFYIHTSLWCLKRSYKDLKGLHEAF